METQEERDAEAAKVSEDAQVMKALIASHGWGLYTKFVESQCVAREQEYLFQPLPSADAVYAQEYAKGEIHALRLALEFPKTFIETAEYEIEQLTRGEENAGNE